MSKLIYSFLASLDGYIADDTGGFGWAVPDEEVLDFINAAERGVGTYLYGRTMYEMMIGWENDPAVAGQSPKSAEFAQIWQAAEKVVFSRSLESVSTKRTRIERSFDPGLVREIKAEAGRDLNVSGANVAASAWHAGLIDESATFSWRRCSSGAASGCFPTTFANRSSCSTNAASETAWSSFATP